MDPVFESLLPVLALLGLAAVVAAAAWLVADPQVRHQDDLLQFALRATGQLLFLAGIAALFVWSFATAGFVISGLVLIVAFLVYAQSRATRRRSLVGLLAAAAEGSMPLAPAVEALAAESPGRLGGRLDDLAGRLRHGVALPEALARTRRVSPWLLPAAAAIGEQCGCLPEALRRRAAEQSDERKLMERVVGQLWYVVLALNIAWIALLFTTLKILPRLQMMVADFDINLDPFGSSIWGLFESPWFLTAMVYLGVPLALMAMAITFGLLWNPASPKPVAWLLWKLQLRGVLDLLALAISRGMPLSSALAVIGDYLEPGRLRRRLRNVALEVVSGESFEHAMRQQRLLTAAQAGVLTAAQRVGNLPWALREMAQTIGRRETLRLRRLMNLLSAVLLGLVSLIVLLTALAVFLPLIQLLRDLQ